MTGTDIAQIRTSIHTALGVRSLIEEIKRASAKLYQRIRQHDNPTIAALGNYDIHTLYS
jgi:Icc-related predicted phosphoesterase